MCKHTHDYGDFATTCVFISQKTLTYTLFFLNKTLKSGFYFIILTTFLTYVCVFFCVFSSVRKRIYIKLLRKKNGGIKKFSLVFRQALGQFFNLKATLQHMIVGMPSYSFRIKFRFVFNTIRLNYYYY